jgi:hypothetical protein
MTGETKTLRRFFQQSGLVAGVRIVAGRAVTPTGGNMGKNSRTGLSHLVPVAIATELVEARHDAEWSLRARRDVTVGTISVGKRQVQPPSEETRFVRGVGIVTTAAIGLDHRVSFVGRSKTIVVLVTGHAVAATGTCRKMSER